MVTVPETVPVLIVKSAFFSPAGICTDLTVAILLSLLDNAIRTPFGEGALSVKVTLPCTVSPDPAFPVTSVMPASSARPDGVTRVLSGSRGRVLFGGACFGLDLISRLERGNYFFLSAELVLTGA